ncbi:nuclear transport factor 2 family protein [Halomontanus rarus]|uniref:nuclear transport factor 2 family protein n=1 Tax=Halomontanus rarus TaxID=3034020 RepID=UPI001A981E53
MTDTTRGNARRSPERILFEFYSRLNRGDVDGAEELLADSVDWVRRTERQSDPIVSDGAESILEGVFLQGDRPDQSHVQAVPERVTAAEGAMLVEGSFVGNGESPFEDSFTHDYEIRDGKITRLVTETDTASRREEITETRSRPAE